MALNSVQNNESQLKSLGQVMNAIGKAVVNHVTNDDVMVAIMVVSVLFLLVAVAMNDVVIIAMSGGVFMLALLPMLYRWSKLPEGKK